MVCVVRYTHVLALVASLAMIDLALLIIPYTRLYLEHGGVPFLSDPSPTSDLIIVALLIAVRSLPEWSFETSPLISSLLPSLTETITQDERARFRFVAYVGFDAGDAVFDNPDMIRRLAKSFEMASISSVKSFFFNSTTGNPVRVWNRLGANAFADNCLYFYQINDDIKMETHGWASSFVDALSSNTVFPGLGVAGPRDTQAGVGVLLTQAFVSRVHFHVFGFLYPPLFKNWFSDNWLTEVYKCDSGDFVYFFKDVTVMNPRNTPRYPVDDSARNAFKILASSGRLQIDEFLCTHYPDENHDPSYRRDPTMGPRIVLQRAGEG